MGSGLDDLKHEHEIIGRVVTVLEAAAHHLERGDAVPLELLRDAVEFIKGFADGCHHRKEEDVLFPLMASKSEQVKEGPVKVLSTEHDAGRHFVADLEKAMAGLENGQAEARRAAARALSLYTQLLRRHIAKENDIFFPLAQSLLVPMELNQLAEQFEAVEQEKVGPGAHARFEALVERLEAQGDTAAGV